MLSVPLVLALLPALSLAAPSNDAALLVEREVRVLAKRADSPSSSSYLSEVFGMVNSRCQSTCDNGALADLTVHSCPSYCAFRTATCSQLTTQATIAACACSSQTLGDLRSCASCISTTTSSSKNATAVVVAYNSFVDLCTQEGLAQVTGTVEVGASTRAMSRTALAPSSASTDASSRATYNPAETVGSTATVPSLLASGSIASSARIAAAASASSSDAAVSASATGAANGRVAASVLALVGAVAGLALLA
ncbi:hypothetical protein JCM8547_004188 [Rhodosporidiobolus lusitaniae]